MKQTVLFWDFDGTLVRKNQSFAESLQTALKEVGLTVPLSACQSFMQAACSWNHPQHDYPARTGEYWWQDLLVQVRCFLQDFSLSPEQQQIVCCRFRILAVQYPYQLYEDAAEILSYVSEKGYQNALLSNNFPQLRETLVHYGLDSFFKACFLSTEIGYEKPRKELFLHALKQMEYPQNAYMIGDNPIADIYGAAQAGLHTVWVHPNQTPCTADHICTALRDLKNIL